MSNDTPPGSGPGDEGAPRWWFEDEIDPETEAEYGLADPDPDPDPAPASVEPEPSLPVVEPEPDPATEPVDAAADHEDNDHTRADAPRARRRRRRRRRRARDTRRPFRVLTALVVAGMLAAALVAVPRDRLRPDPVPSPDATQRPPAATEAEQDTLLLVRHSRRDRGPALGITLLVASPDTAAVIFVPEGVFVDIPGFGQDRLGLAYQYGGSALVEASLENLLGIDIDHTAAVSNSGLSAFVERTGGLDVDVSQRLVARSQAGAARVRFEPGEQFLDGERLVEFWGFRQRGESELDTFPRQQLVWASLLEAAEDPQVVEALTSDGAPQLDTSADAEFLASMLTRLSAAQSTGELQYTLLPVTPFGAADETGASTYRPDPTGMTDLVEGVLAGSVPASGETQGVRIQVLNGVGTPGIGQEVDERLEGAGFRILLTDNARSFDFDETRILVYSEDERSLAAAEEVQRRLGVGTIQISRQPQSVVDLTIVVGADFTAEQRADGDPFPEPEEQSS